MDVRSVSRSYPMYTEASGIREANWTTLWAGLLLLWIFKEEFISVLTQRVGTEEG